MSDDTDLLFRYRQQWQKEAEEDTKTVALMAAYIASQGIEARTAVTEAFKILDEVRKRQEERLEIKVKAQQKQMRGY